MGKRKRNKRENSQDRGGPSREKHPSHLVGKEIGLFYAKRHRQKNKHLQNQPLCAISVSQNKREQIQAMLNSTSFKNLFVVDGSSYEHVEDSFFKRDFLRVISESIDDKLKKAPVIIPDDSQLDQRYHEEFMLKQINPRYIDMLTKRKKLPAYDMKDEILKLVKDNQVVVISGETGCGKTTQVAQFILDEYLENEKGSECKVVCTQPRRISAISVAQRVASERTEKLGDSVGYQIRMEKRLPRERASICFCTTGVVLKIMESDPSLSQVTHLILDEIHERDVMSDFILALIKKIRVQRRDLKIVLMSATLNSKKFSKYFDNSPHLNIPGFTFPVEEFYLEDVLLRTGFVYQNNKVARKKAQQYQMFIEPYIRELASGRQYSRHVCSQLSNAACEELNLELVLELLINICQTEQDEGAILVFLTGFGEISTLTRMVTTCGQFPPNRFLVFPLHSLMPTVDQAQIFEAPPRGKRKIIIATNIAETSITIDDVVYVIDCGKIKVSGFNVANNTDVLAPEWVSQANADQRKGRAGRVKPGVCFHLFSKARKFMLEPFLQPEILRKRLEDVILTAKVLQLGDIENFFSQLVDSPDPGAVSLALNLLKRLNALTNDENLTPLGYHLAKLPMAPQMGKMILFGAMFSCLDPILSIAATLDYKDPFQLPVGKEKEVTEMKLELSAGIKSDHVLFHEALSSFERKGFNNRNFCYRYFLNYHTLKQLQDMKKQFMQYLFEMKFVTDTNPKSPEFNRNSDNLSLIKAIVCAGLYPNIAISRILGKRPVHTPDGQKIAIHPKSVLADCKRFDTNILVYYRKVYSNMDYIHDGTLIHPLPVIFFGDNFQRTFEGGRNMISINENLKFLCSKSTALIIQELRDRFNWFLQHKISHPGPVIWGQSDDTKVLEVITELFTDEDLELYDDETFEDV